MPLGEVIRTYRKQNHMTQEEMARRLGVTAPAVNKWENGNSFPDITLLAPIARLLHISLDTLLSFQEELTAEEIAAIIGEANLKLKESTYNEAFQWAKKKLAEYPNCEQLTWQIAVIFDAQRAVQELPNAADYDECLHALYIRALESKDETIRNSAADSLFYFFLRKKQYDKAEKYLKYFSIQNPERKRKLAQLYSETSRIEEAYQIYEELLFSHYQMASVALHGMYMLAVQDRDMEKAHMLVEKQAELARCFEMGTYYEVSYRLDLAALEQDTETAITAMEKMLASADQIHSFCKAPLYAHMKFKEANPEFLAELKNNLLLAFGNKESFGFLKQDPRWLELLSRK